MNNELETASEWKLIWKRFIKHKLALFGLSFKPNTNDVRDSTSIKIAKKFIIWDDTQILWINKLFNLSVIL